MNLSKKIQMLAIAAASIVGLSACNDTKDVLGLPIISDISPESGDEDGGTLVTITGENLDDNVTIEIGGVDCAFETFTSNEEVSCFTGANEVTADTTYDVVVTNPDGDSDTLEDAFTYLND